MEWKISTHEKCLYLTFDDGPEPEITPWILDLLAQYNAKATFFCVGENAQRNPEIIQRILKEGHSLGNHTHNHLKGWNTKDAQYVQNTIKASKSTSNKLFRPPYGRIKKTQIHLLKALGYKIIMWNQLSCDYLQNLNTDKSLQTLIKHASPGNIVVFHDSIKASKNVTKILPLYLEAMTKAGYTFKAI